MTPIVQYRNQSIGESLDTERSPIKFNQQLFEEVASLTARNKKLESEIEKLKG